MKRTRIGRAVSGSIMPTRMRKSPSIDVTAFKRSARVEPRSIPYAAVSWPVSLMSRIPDSTYLRIRSTRAASGTLDTRPRATRVMQYVHRPAHPWAIGTIASLHAACSASVSRARSSQTVPAPRSSRIRVLRARRDPVAPGHDRFLHEAGLPVVLRAAVGLEVHLHDPGECGVAKSLSGLRSSRTHGGTPRNPRPEPGAEAAGEGGETPSEGGRDAAEGLPARAEGRPIEAAGGGVRRHRGPAR